MADEAQGVSPKRGKRTRVQMPDLVPAWADHTASVLLELSRGEDASLRNPPTLKNLEDLFRKRAFRYLYARLKSRSNEHVNATYRPDSDLDRVPFETRRGIVMGLREAMGMVGLVLQEANSREGRVVQIPEPYDDSDFDDFGEERPGDLKPLDNQQEEL